MASPYIIILSDSEDELEQIPDSPAYDPYLDYEPEEATDSDTNSDMSIDEEILMENPPAPLSPVHYTYDRSGPYTVVGPRKSVANSCRRTAPTVAPTDDPYRNPYEDSAVVGRIRETLQEMKRLHDVPTTHEIGESSSAPSLNPITGEPSHHTIPLLVAHAGRHNDRLDLMEGVIMDLPLDLLDEKISTVALEVANVRDETRELKEKAVEGTQEMNDLKKKVDEVVGKMDALKDMIAMLKDHASKILKKQGGPK